MKEELPNEIWRVIGTHLSLEDTLQLRFMDDFFPGEELLRGCLSRLGLSPLDDHETVRHRAADVLQRKSPLALYQLSSAELNVLECAVTLDDYELVKALVEMHGAWILGESSSGRPNAFHAAILLCREEIAKAMLGMSPDLADLWLAGPRIRLSPLAMALENLQLSLARELLESGVQTFPLDSRGSSASVLVCRALVRNGRRTHQIENSLEENFKFILQEDRKFINQLNEQGYAPLHELCISPGDGRWIDLALDCGAHIEARCHNTATPLILAAGQGSPSAVQALIRRGANLHSTTKDGETALHRAMLRDDDHQSIITICRILIESGSNLQRRTVMDQTPLMVAELAMRQRTRPDLAHVIEALS